MKCYLESLLFSQEKNIPTTQQIDHLMRDLQNDNSMLENQVREYEKKIAQLPREIRRKIHQQQYQPSELSESIQFSGKVSHLEENSEQTQSPNSPNIFSSMVDKNLLEEKLRNLQEEEQQIEYISRLSDMYIRCKKQPQNIISFERNDQGEPQNSHIELTHNKSTLQRQQLQEIAEFIKSIKPYSTIKNPSSSDSHDYNLISDLVSNMKIHTSKKLTEKCQNLVHYGSSGNNDKIVIENFLIKNCKSIILGEESEKQSTKKGEDSKSGKIISKFIEKILSDVIYYDVSYQKIVLMEVIELQNPSSSPHTQTIHRKKVYFFPSETEINFQKIKFTLSYHLQKARDLKSLFQPYNSSTFSNTFDKILERQVLVIKSNLEYILPYINISSRKVVMEILADGKDEIIEFEDLVLRLKFKGLDGEMFMNNLDVVFARLVDLEEKNDHDGENQSREMIQFKDKNFETLTSFFELGIFEAQESLLQTSSKAIKKLTTNLASLHSRQKFTSSKHTSKKLFNMIFFSVSNLIERFDELLYKGEEKFCQYSRNLGMTYEQKVIQWVDKLIEIREGVRKRIHEE